MKRLPWPWQVIASSVLSRLDCVKIICNFIAWPSMMLIWQPRCNCNCTWNDWSLSFQVFRHLVVITDICQSMMYTVVKSCVGFFLLYSLSLLMFVFSRYFSGFNCRWSVFCAQLFFGNLSYQVAMSYVESGLPDILLSTSALFTLILASVFPATNNDRFTLSKFVAVALRFVCMWEFFFILDLLNDNHILKYPIMY